MITEQNIYFGIWFGLFVIFMYFREYLWELFGKSWGNLDKTFIDMLIIATGIFIVCTMIYRCVRWGSTVGEGEFEDSVVGIPPSIL